MPMMRPFAWLAALAAVCGLASTAGAQTSFTHAQPPYSHLPFIEPGYFQPDFQFFAPAEVDDFGGWDPPNTGVYFDYDRTYVWMSRPEGEPSLFSDVAGDFTWGNRFELGYMLGDPTGFQAVLWHIDGPNEAVSVVQERLDRFNDDDDPPDNADPIINDRNPRFYDVRTSINQAKFSSFELNRVWRKRPFHNGAILEPLVGFRYMKFKDFYVRDSYQRFDEDANGQPVPVPTTVDGVFEQFTRDSTVFDNAMFGGQLGARLFYQQGHWLLSAEVRFFACQNFQLLETMHSETLTRYSGVGGDPELENVDSPPTVTRRLPYQHASEFVWGGEVRAEASYELTREINLRFGMVFLDLAQGIGRGPQINRNSQDVQVAGLTFGFTINR